MSLLVQGLFLLGSIASLVVDLGGWPAMAAITACALGIGSARSLWNIIRPLPRRRER